MTAARPGSNLPPGKTRYPFYRSLGVPQGRSGRAENLVPTGIRSRTVQPVVCYMELVKLGQVFVRVYRFCPVSVITHRLFVIFKQYN